MVIPPLVQAQVQAKALDSLVPPPLAPLLKALLMAPKEFDLNQHLHRPLSMLQSGLNHYR